MSALRFRFRPVFTERFPRPAQRKYQRLFRYRSHERTNQPSQPFRNIPSKRDSLKLHIHAPIALPEAPVRVETPEVSVVVSHRHFMLVRPSSIFHLRHLSAIGVTAGPRRVHANIMHVILRIQSHPDYVRFLQSKRKFEIISTMLEQLGTNYARRINSRMIVICL